MVPHWWDETLTLYRRQATRDANGRTSISWQREVLHNCFFGVMDKQYFDGSAIIRQPSYVVRVPATYAILVKGDIIMRGEAADETPDKTADNAFVVNIVKDNSKMRNAHYYGSEDRAYGR